MTAVCGDKKPDAARRKGLGAEVRKYEDFRQKDVQRFDSMYSVKAASHTAGRNQAVAELLSCLSLLRSLGDIPQPQPILTWSKAQVGALSGTVDSPAAHCLPCQVWVNNALPWDLVRSPLVNRSQLIKNLREEIFGHETILPLAFNLADSLSETNCLRGALISACQHVIAHSKPRQREGVLKRSGDGTILLTVNDRPGAARVGVDHQAVRHAYGIWQQHAAAAYDSAAEQAAQGIRHSGTDYTSDVLYILEKYDQSLATLPPRASDQWISKFENDLWV